jgi:hypothetical protein
MISELEVRQKLAELLADQLDLEEFEDWLVQRSWNMHLDSSAGAQSLVSAVELALSEHSSGHLSEESLFDQLRSLLQRDTVASRVA